MLVLIGEGQAPQRPAVRRRSHVGCRHSPITLRAKEGLALINGTQVMTAIGALAVHDAENLAAAADVAAALTIEALLGTTAAFDARAHAVRPHAGQQLSAANILSLMDGSEIRRSHIDCPKVQDAYPQVRGAGARASRDAIAYARRVVEVEINSATDNPLLFPTTAM